MTYTEARCRKSHLQFIYAMFLLFAVHSKVHGQRSWIPLKMDGYEYLRNAGISPDGNVVFAYVVKSSSDDTLTVRNIDANRTFKYSGIEPVSFFQRGKYLLVQRRYPFPRASVVDTENGREISLNTKSNVSIADDNETLLYADSTTRELVIHNILEGSLMYVKFGRFFVLDPGRKKVAVSIIEPNGSLIVIKDIKSLKADTAYQSRSISESTNKILWSPKGDAISFVTYDKVTGEPSKVYLYSIVGMKGRIDSIHLNKSVPSAGNAPVDFDRHFSIGGDSKTVIFALKSVKNTSEDASKSVTIWHSENKKSLDSYGATERGFIRYGAWSFSNRKYFEINSDSLPTVQLTPSGRYAIIFDPDQYGPSFAADTSDIYLKDLETGGQKRILTRLPHNYRYNAQPIIPSPGGKYFCYWLQHQWWVYIVSSGQHVNLTGKMPFPVWDSASRWRSRTETPEIPVWTKDDKEIIIYDAFDVYAVDPITLAIRKLTDGRGENTQYRIASISVEPRRKVVDLSKPLLLISTREIGWKSGNAILWPDGTNQSIVFDDNENNIHPAETYERFLLTRWNGDRFPELLLMNKNGLGNSEMLLKTNSGLLAILPKSKLVSYTSPRGELLQGALYYPSGYSEARKYPMIVSIYQLQSNYVRQHPLPYRDNDGERYSDYLDAGYFVFLPDIKYRANNPGFSALECVEAGVREVIATEKVDPAKIGLTGESFGGFETGFILSQSRLFTAGIAQCGVYDLISKALQETIARENGYRFFEYQQGRIYGTLADKLQDYVANSPVIHAQNITASLLNIVGRKDNVVPWTQSLELFNAMRRFGKRTSLVVYENGGHTIATTPEEFADLRQKKMDWWNHYLKGGAAADWMRNDQKLHYVR